MKTAGSTISRMSTEVGAAIRIDRAGAAIACRRNRAESSGAISRRTLRIRRAGRSIRLGATRVGANSRAAVPADALGIDRAWASEAELWSSSLCIPGRRGQARDSWDQERGSASQSEFLYKITTADIGKHMRNGVCLIEKSCPSELIDRQWKKLWLRFRLEAVRNLKNNSLRCPSALFQQL